MSTSEVLEALMLGCFSLGWYWSIFAMLWTGRPYGKSAGFVAFTVIGYMLGLTARLLDFAQDGTFSYLIVLYCWNLAITGGDLALLLWLTRRQKSVAPAPVPKPWEDFSMPPAPPRYPAGH